VGELGTLTRHLSPEEITVLRSSMSTRAVPANTTLITAGEHNDTLFFVTQGEFLVALPFEKGPLFVGTRAQHSWVGEVTLLDPGPASATVTAARDSEVLALSAATLAELTRSHPALVAHLVRALSEDLAHRVRTAGVVLDEAPQRPAPGFFKGVFGRLFGGGSVS
jgi:CRP-like cAMP-binding protein